MRILLACSFLGLAALAIADYRQDLERRRPIDAFVVRYTIDERRPEAAWSVRTAYSSDDAALAAGSAAAADASEGTNLRDLSPELQQRWLQAMEHGDDSLRDAAPLVMNAIPLRPAGADYFALLARLRYLRVRRSMRAEELVHPALWMAPARVAAKLAPSDDSVANFVAACYFESWSFLDAAEQQQGRVAARRSLLDSSFAVALYPTLAVILGGHETLSLLPDVAGTLRVALESPIEPRLSPQDLGELLRRWERAEWQARVADLQKIEAYDIFGDAYEAGRMCETWLQVHPAEDFDAAAGRAQAAKLLDLWPASLPGTWKGDGRAKVIRYLLQGRSDTPAPLARAAIALTDVPPVVQARAAALSGERAEGEAIYHEQLTSSITDRADYLVEVAAAELRAGNVPLAKAALDEVPPTAAGECNVTAIRAALAPAHAAAPLPDEVRISDDRTHGVAFELCLLPGRVKQIALQTDSDADAIVHFGWDGGRLASAVVTATSVATIPVDASKLMGRHVLRVWPAAATPTGLTVRARFP